jgi:hypothetical protein
MGAVVVACMIIYFGLLVMARLLIYFSLVVMPFGRIMDFFHRSMIVPGKLVLFSAPCALFFQSLKPRQREFAFIFCNTRSAIAITGSAGLRLNHYYARHQNRGYY